MEANLWLRLLLILTGFLFSLFLFNAIIRKWLKVERKKIFSYNHVNMKHKKIDWGIRITTVVALFIGYMISITRDPIGMNGFFHSSFILFSFIIVSETVRAIMEKKYASNPNDYKFTISQLIFIVIFVIILYTTEFFGFLNAS